MQMETGMLLLWWRRKTKSLVIWNWLNWIWTTAPQVAALEHKKIKTLCRKITTNGVKKYISNISDKYCISHEADLKRYLSWFSGRFYSFINKSPRSWNAVTIPLWIHFKNIQLLSLQSRLFKGFRDIKIFFVTFHLVTLPWILNQESQSYKRPVTLVVLETLRRFSPRMYVYFLTAGIPTPQK